MLRLRLDACVVALRERPRVRLGSSQANAWSPRRPSLGVPRVLLASAAVARRGRSERDCLGAFFSPGVTEKWSAFERLFVRGRSNFLAAVPHWAVAWPPVSGVMICGQRRAVEVSVVTGLVFTWIGFALGCSRECVLWCV